MFASQRSVNTTINSQSSPGERWIGSIVDSIFCRRLSRTRLTLYVYRWSFWTLSSTYDRASGKGEWSCVRLTRVSRVVNTLRHLSEIINEPQNSIWHVQISNYAFQPLARHSLFKLVNTSNLSQDIIGVRSIKSSWFLLMGSHYGLVSVFMWYKERLEILID